MIRARIQRPAGFLRSERRHVHQRQVRLLHREEEEEGLGDGPQETHLHLQHRGQHRSAQWGLLRQQRQETQVLDV